MSQNVLPKERQRLLDDPYRSSLERLMAREQDASGDAAPEPAASSMPLVSVIVTTRNNHQTLDACLASIMRQTYEAIELIVVDRDSSDGTKLIARYYTDQVYNHGPERSAQRNFGVRKAHGEFVVIIDSDMELTRNVISDCVDVFYYHEDTSGVIIPEESFGVGFWARCKRLERSFYRGNDWLEAPRFFRKDVYEETGGYDETMVSGEDWDLGARVRQCGRVARINAHINHNEGRLHLIKSLRKKYYYAGQARVYLRKNPLSSSLSQNVGPLRRYRLFFSQPGKLFSNPIAGIGMLLMKTFEFSFGALGYLLSGLKKRESA
ncbi:MAG TPA: glycosyltransferase [Candidatus Saccharimonadales bacterium]|nr:glycosyltransferase [Candidatus Saccharimonadales bacterium]